MKGMEAAAAVTLLLTLLAGFIRVFRGPTPADRMLAAQLFGTTGVAVLALLSRVEEIPALLDAAMVFAVLAAITIIAFVRRYWRTSTRGRGCP